jgi:hypothetical protein
MLHLPAVQDAARWFPRWATSSYCLARDTWIPGRKRAASQLRDP